MDSRLRGNDIFQQSPKISMSHKNTTTFKHRYTNTLAHRHTNTPTHHHISAIIFDFDGVLTNTEPAHMRAWQKTLNPLGITLDPKHYKTHYIGIGDINFVNEIPREHDYFPTDEEKTLFLKTKQKWFIEELKKEVLAFDGVNFLLKAVSKKFPLAIVTGAQRNEIKFVLKKQKWNSYFQNIITTDDVQNGKPDPEGFLKAFPKIPPRNILVIEDSPRGIEGAKKAGMWCIALLTSYPRERLKQADWIIADHRDLLTFIESL